MLNSREIEERDEEMVSDFDIVVDRVHYKMVTEKISLTESLKVRRKKLEKSLKKNETKYIMDINTIKDEPYDSSHVVYVPVLQDLARKFIKRMKEKREGHIARGEMWAPSNTERSHSHSRSHQTKGERQVTFEDNGKSDSGRRLIDDPSSKYLDEALSVPRRSTEMLEPRTSVDQAHYQSIQTSRSKDFLYKGNEFHQGGREDGVFLNS